MVLALRVVNTKIQEDMDQGPIRYPIIRRIRPNKNNKLNSPNKCSNYYNATNLRVMSTVKSIA